MATCIHKQNGGSLNGCQREKNAWQDAEKKRLVRKVGKSGG